MQLGKLHQTSYRKSSVKIAQYDACFQVLVVLPFHLYLSKQLKTDNVSSVGVVPGRLCS
jgi:hypothetical protein